MNQYLFWIFEKEHICNILQSLFSCIITNEVTSSVRKGNARFPEFTLFENV
jgi:hypothetical protein